MTRRPVMRLHTIGSDQVRVRPCIFIGVEERRTKQNTVALADSVADHVFLGLLDPDPLVRGRYGSESGSGSFYH